MVTVTRSKLEEKNKMDVLVLKTSLSVYNHLRRLSTIEVSGHLSVLLLTLVAAS